MLIINHDDKFKYLLSYLNNESLLKKDLKNLDLKNNCSISYCINTNKLLNYQIPGKTICKFSYKKSMINDFESLFKEVLNTFLIQLNNYYAYLINPDNIEDYFIYFENGSFMLSDLKLETIIKLLLEKNNSMYLNWIKDKINKENDVFDNILYEYLTSYNNTIDKSLFNEIFFLVNKSTKTINAFNKFNEKLYNDSEYIKDVIVKSQKNDYDHKRYINFYKDLYKKVPVNSNNIFDYIELLYKSNEVLDSIFIKEFDSFNYLLSLPLYINTIKKIYLTDSFVKTQVKDIFNLKSNSVNLLLRFNETNIYIEEKTKSDLLKDVTYLNSYFSQFSDLKYEIEKLKTFDINDKSLKKNVIEKKH